MCGGVGGLKKVVEVLECIARIGECVRVAHFFLCRMRDDGRQGQGLPLVDCEPGHCTGLPSVRSADVEPIRRRSADNGLDCQQFCRRSARDIARRQPSRARRWTLSIPDGPLAASLRKEGRTEYPLVRPRRRAGRFHLRVPWLSGAVRRRLIRSLRMRQRCSL